MSKPRRLTDGRCDCQQWLLAPTHLYTYYNDTSNSRSLSVDDLYVGVSAAQITHWLVGESTRASAAVGCNRHSNVAVQTITASYARWLPHLYNKAHLLINQQNVTYFS